MQKYFLLTIFFVVTAVSVPAQDKKSEPGSRLKQYFFVLLKKGPVRNQDSLKVQEIQRQHMAHIQEMADSKKLVIAGPFGDDGDLRGIFIFNVPTFEEAKSLAESDPAVKSGRLVAEIHPWFSEPACLP